MLSGCGKTTNGILIYRGAVHPALKNMSKHLANGFGQNCNLKEALNGKKKLLREFPRFPVIAIRTGQIKTAFTYSW